MVGVLGIQDHQPQKCAPPCAYLPEFLLILCPMQMVFEFFEYILALLDPILYHRCSVVPKYNLHKGERIITVQSPERRHTNRHVVGGVVTILTQV
jgi:hypothetical protein